MSKNRLDPLRNALCNLWNEAAKEAAKAVGHYKIAKKRFMERLSEPGTEPVIDTTGCRSEAEKSPAFNPDQKLLMLFQEYPHLVSNNDVSRKSPKQLRAMAEKIFLRNEEALHDRRAQDAFHSVLHRNMLRESGILGVIHTMLQAAKNRESLRWTTYCSYARRQMEELGELEFACTRSVSSPADSSMLTVQELEQKIRQQLDDLKADPVQTEYLPLYHAIKNVSLEVSGSLETWYPKAAEQIRKGMDCLAPDLQKELRIIYPEF